LEIRKFDLLDQALVIPQASVVGLGGKLTIV
jgi:hypothetical protein